MRQTRAASVEALVEAARPRLRRMLAYGTTTMEAKTGYGLETQAELRQLEAIYRLAAEGPWTLVPTFLPAHAVPAEFNGRADDYTDLVIEEMLPAAAALRAQVSLAGARPPLFCDVFCEEGAFNLAQSRRILEHAQDLEFGLKIHADEFSGLGGTALAVALGAVSADHLVYTPAEDIAALGRGETAAVGLPGTPFGLAQRDYTPAGKILAAGGLLALATDLNPGTTWCESMQMVVALACRYMRLTPAQPLPRRRSMPPARWAWMTRWQPGGRQTGRSAGAGGAGLPAPGLSVWHEFGADGDQSGERGHRGRRMNGVSAGDNECLISVT